MDVAFRSNFKVCFAVGKLDCTLLVAAIDKTLLQDGKIATFVFIVCATFALDRWIVAFGGVMGRVLLGS